MKTAKVILLVICLALLAGLAAFVNSSPVSASNPQPVIVTNTPLPVSAAQNGTWNVGISGTPSVSVANTALATKDQYNLALATPANFTDSFTMGPNEFGGESNLYVVPANHRLVVDYVSMLCDLPSGDAIARLASDQDHHGSSSFMGVFVPMQSVPYSALCPGCVRSTGGSPAQVLIDGGFNLQLTADRTNGSGTASCFGGFTGYLISVP